LSSKIGIGFRVAGLQADRGFISPAGIAVSAELLQRNAEIAIRLRIAGLQGDGALVKLHCLLQMSGFLQHAANVRVDGSEIRF
jgi:hypothetical protein